MVDPIRLLGAIQDELKTSIQAAEQEVTRGRMLDYPAYARACGEIAGLKKALNVVIDFQGRVEED